MQTLINSRIKVTNRILRHLTGCKVFILLTAAIGGQSALANYDFPESSRSTISASSKMELNCGSLTTSGALTIRDASLSGVKDFSILHSGVVFAGGSEINVAGNFSAQGLFEGSGASLTIEDGCYTSESTLSGILSLENLTIRSSIGKSLSLTPNTTINISGALNISGTEVNPITLTGDNGTLINMLPGAQVITSNAIISAPIINSANIKNVPTISGIGYALLSLMILVFSFTYSIFRVQFK